jgi:CrcB protein
MNYFMMAIGGAIGTLLRFALSTLITGRSNSVFPWGTFIVNLTGCFFIGILAGLAIAANYTMNTRAFLFIGLLGGFTTFSTFAFEGLQLFKGGYLLAGLSYVTLSNLFGILLAAAGFLITQPKA